MKLEYRKHQTGWNYLCHTSRLEESSKQRQDSCCIADRGEEPLTERERKLMKENARLREANGILKGALRFFVNDRKQ